MRPESIHDGAPCFEVLSSFSDLSLVPGASGDLEMEEWGRAKLMKGRCLVEENKVDGACDRRLRQASYIFPPLSPFSSFNLRIATDPFGS